VIEINDCILTVVMAVFNPNIDFFTKQLASINYQDFRRFKVDIRDDVSDDFERIKIVVASMLTDTPYTITRNEKNLGSNKTFEILLADCTTEYIAFCDQDDIWRRDKLSLCLQGLKDAGTTIAYTDSRIINENDNVIFANFSAGRRRVKHRYGEGIWKDLIRKNSITGCTMVARSNAIRCSLPFPPADIYVWDQWVAIHGSLAGSVRYIPDALVSYRIHSNNQVGTIKLSGIASKDEYVQRRLTRELRSIDFLHERISDPYILKIIQRKRHIVETRIDFVYRKGCVSISSIWQMATSDFPLFLLETTLAFGSLPLIEKMIRIIKKSRF
jgi:hypothetical protein